MLLGFLRSRQGRFQEATTALEAGFISFRSDPWVMSPIYNNSFTIAHFVASQDPTGAIASRLYRALEKPFCVFAAEQERRRTLALLGVLADGANLGESTRKAVEAFEPDVPWDRKFLEVRRDCYRSLGDPKLAKAEQDLARFLKAEPQPLDVRPAPSATPGN